MIHRIADLQWRFYDRAVPLEPLKVLAERRFVWDGASVRIAALAASHAVVLERDGAILTELLTCGAPPADAVAAGPAEAIAVARWRVDARHSVAAVDAQPSGDERLEVVYPGVDGARTTIAWSTAGGRLTVETVHTYPEEAASLLSRSEFERVTEI